MLPLLSPEARARGEPARGGYLDLLEGGAPPPSGPLQRLMLAGVVPPIYERWWRPALGRLAKGPFGPGMADERRIARLLLEPAPGDGVLDVACGTGGFSRDLAPCVGGEGLVVGLDVSGAMLTSAVRATDEAGLEQVAYVRGDAEDLPFRARSFDAVCCFAALHLFAQPARALDRMSAVLTPGGRIALFTTVLARSLPLRVAESAAASSAGARMFDRRELVDTLSAHGFVDVRQRIAGVTQFVGGRLPGVSAKSRQAVVSPE